MLVDPLARYLEYLLIFLSRLIDEVLKFVERQMFMQKTSIIVPRAKME
jgi:hypothetical protein